MSRFYSPILIALLIIIPGMKAVEKIQNYSAVQFEIHPNGSERPGQNIYVSGDHYRIVMAESPMDTGSAAFIFQKDSKIIRTLFPEKKELSGGIVVGITV